MFLLNLQSKEPIYEQIQKQLIRFIQAGVLNPGDKLPSVRQLAQENGINPNTVAKAYSELEKTGCVYNAPKKGVYVARMDVQQPHRHQIAAVLAPLKEMGIQKQEILDAVKELYGEGEHAEN
ncbi:MAG: GntR family transcriptional regulator [Lactimicrobium massiliense]|nr:GntR family transcriptional regulator [Lactimicrobium massiliense]MDD6457609.1 GntR family transcriptional regulator [Lactimicrobium massiliense]